MRTGGRRCIREQGVHIRWGRLLLALFIGVFVVQACESVTVTAVQVSSVAMAPSTATLQVGDSVLLAATPHGPSGAPLPDRAVTWTSADPSRASVSASGWVRAAASGSVEIRATVDGVTGTALVTVQPRPVIVLSTEDVLFTSTFAGGGPAPFPVTLSNGEAGPLTGLQATVRFPPGQPTGWLLVSLSGASAPAMVTLTANPGSLSAGTYQAEVTVTSPSAANSPRTISVRLVVEQAPPRIRVQPDLVGFTSDEGQTAPPPQSVQVTNAGGGILSGLASSVAYSAGQAGGWLTAQLSSTSAPAEIALTVDPTGLVPATYDAVLRVTSTSTPGDTATVRVRFRLGSPPPELELGTANRTLIIMEGSPPPAIQSIAVENRGSGSITNLAATVSHPAGQPTDWLQATLSATTAPAALLLAVDPTGLLPASYSAFVEVSSPDAINSPQGVQFQLLVTQRPSPLLSTITAAPTSIVADGTSVASVTVALIDGRGDPVVGGGHTVSLQTSAGTLGPVTGSGPGTVAATLTAGTSVATAVITGTLNGQAMTDQATVTFVPGPASALRMVTEPVGGASGAELAQQPIVEIVDAQGNRITDNSTAEVVASLASGAGGILSGMDTVVVVNGLATFTDLALTGIADEPYVLGFASDGLTPTNSAAVFVDAGQANQLSITTQPSDTVQSGVIFPQQPAIQLQDASGNPVAQPGVMITADIASGGGSLGGTLTATTDGTGLATFTDLAISGTVGDRTLRFSAPGLVSVTSGTITVNAGPASALRMVTQPVGGDSGAILAQQPIVEIVDAQGNRVTDNSTAEVRASLASGADGILSGTATITAVNGVATFTDLALTGIVDEPYVLGFASDGLTPTNSAAVFVDPGQATRLFIATQPSDTVQSGEPFPQQPTIQLRDASGNRVRQSGVVITAAIASGGGLLSGPLTATTSQGGVATFTDLAISGTVGDHTLIFSAPGLVSVTSDTITVTPGPPFGILLSGPSEATVDEPSAPFTLTIVDSAGNPTPATDDFQFELTGDDESDASFAPPSPVTVPLGTDVALDLFVYVELELGTRVVTATGIGEASALGSAEHTVTVNAATDDN